MFCGNLTRANPYFSAIFLILAVISMTWCALWLFKPIRNIAKARYSRMRAESNGTEMGVFREGNRRHMRMDFCSGGSIVGITEKGCSSSSLFPLLEKLVPPSFPRRLPLASNSRASVPPTDAQRGAVLQPPLFHAIRGRAANEG